MGSGRQMKDGVVQRCFEGLEGRSSHLQLIVPSYLCNTVLHELHQGAVGGHLGHEKMTEAEGMIVLARIWGQ